jgi:hypothetical protein
MRSFFLLWQQLLEVLKQSLHPPSNSHSAAGVVMEVNLHAGQTVASSMLDALQELLLLPQGPSLTAWGVLTRAHRRHSTAQHTSKPASQAKLPGQKAFACTIY